MVVHPTVLVMADRVVRVLLIGPANADETQTKVAETETKAMEAILAKFIEKTPEKSKYVNIKIPTLVIYLRIENKTQINITYTFGK